MKLALDSMAKLYCKTLKHGHTGYANVTLRQLLDHLVTTYAAIYRINLENNQEKMTARYDPNAPIETLFGQITDGISYAELGEAPFTSKQIVDIAPTMFSKNGGVQRRPEGVESITTPQL